MKVVMGAIQIVLDDRQEEDVHIQKTADQATTHPSDISCQLGGVR